MNNINKFLYRQKKLCPFASKLIISQQLITNFSALVYIYIGSFAKKTAEKFIMEGDNALFLPPWIDPSEFNYPVKNCKVIITDTSGADKDYCESLVKELYMARALVVCLFDYDKKLTIYDKELNHV